MRGLRFALPIRLSRGRVTVRMRVFDRFNNCVTDRAEEIEMDQAGWVEAPWVAARAGQHTVRFDFDPPLGGVRGARLNFRRPWQRVVPD